MLIRKFLYGTDPLNTARVQPQGHHDGCGLKPRDIAKTCGPHKEQTLSLNIPFPLPGPGRWLRTACTKCSAPLRWGTSSGRARRGIEG